MYLENFKLLRKYWIRMEPCSCEVHPGINHSKPNRPCFGVTAFGLADALSLLHRKFPEFMASHKVLSTHPFKSTIDVVTKIDLEAFPGYFAVTAERQPYLNFGGPWRGVWYPLGVYHDRDHRLSAIGCRQAPSQPLARSSFRR